MGRHEPAGAAQARGAPSDGCAHEADVASESESWPSPAFQASTNWGEPLWPFAIE